MRKLCPYALAAGMDNVCPRIRNECSESSHEIADYPERIAA